MARDDTGPIRAGRDALWPDEDPSYPDPSHPDSGYGSPVDYGDRIGYAESARGRIDRDVARAERNPHLRDHLAESEVIRIGTRQHPVVLAKPVLGAVLGLVVSIYLVGTDIPLRVPLILLLGCLGWLGVRWLQWSRHFFLATDHRVLKMYGVLSTTVDSMKVVKVTDMTYHRGIVGEVLGFGSITIESAGQDQALHDIDYIPYPRENYQELCHIIIGENPRIGGKKQHRFRRRLERIAQHSLYARPTSRYEVAYPDHSHLEDPPPTRADDAHPPRVLYSSHEDRAEDTSPIPIYPPGHFSRGEERERKDDLGRDRLDDDFPDHDDPTRP